MPIEPAETFKHVADSYRWLASAARSWQDLKEGGFTDRQRAELDRLLPNADVMVQACALIYSRGLIEFYRAGWAGDGGRTPRKTDLSIANFGITLDEDDEDLKYLIDVKDSIDKHLAHLTELRHAGHPDRLRHPRLDWDTEIPIITKRLIELLAKVGAKREARCRSSFENLLVAVRAQMSDRLSQWPSIDCRGGSPGASSS